MDKAFVNGEVIYYYDSSRLSTGLMYALYLKRNSLDDALIMSEHGAIQNQDFSKLYRLSDKDELYNIIVKSTEVKINELKSQLKPTRRSAYKDEIDGKYKELKQRIINLSRSISGHRADEDDYINDEFEDMIKEMSQLKKQIFEIKCEGNEEARKFNGQIKYQIKELIKCRDYAEKKLNQIPERFRLLV